MVKQVISNVGSDSSGGNTNTTTNITLNYTNVSLPNDPVVPSTTWGQFQIQNGNLVDTGDWMGLVEVSSAPWIYRYDEGRYVYVPIESANSGKGWTYTP
jgi:hypothetical protein